MDFKCHFDARLDALKASRNKQANPADIAMDFLYALDNTRYGEFKDEVVKVCRRGLPINLDDLNKMYLLASCRVMKTTKDAGRAVFVKNMPNSVDDIW